MDSDPYMSTRGHKNYALNNYQLPLLFYHQQTKLVLNYSIVQYDRYSIWELFRPNIVCLQTNPLMCSVLMMMALLFFLLFLHVKKGKQTSIIIMFPCEIRYMVWGSYEGFMSQQYNKMSIAD